MEPDNILGRLAAVEKQNGELGRNMQTLLDALAVTGAIEQRHAVRLKDRQEWLETLQSAEQRHREKLDDVRDVLAEGFRLHEEALRQQQEAQHLHEQRMAEIQDKLNALIDIIDRPQKPPDER